MDARTLPSQARYRQPPYARRLANMLDSDVFIAGGGTPWILAGSAAWRQARDWKDGARAFLVLPPGETPETLDWSLIARLPSPVLLRPCGDLSLANARAIAAAVLRDGSERVLYLRPGSSIRFTAETEVRHAA